MNNNKKIIISLLPALLLATILTTAVLPLVAYGQDEEEEEEDNGGGNGGDGVTATVNGESFNKGDAVTISGSVGEEGGGDNSLFARVYDPDFIELDIERVHINADGTFRYGIATDAGPLEGGLSDPMTKSGTYTVTFEYFGDSGRESGEVTFEYDAQATSSGGGDDSATLAEAGPTTTFQNLTEGFRIQVPNGWVADDLDISDSIREQFVATNGFVSLGAMCPQETALPKIGGLYDCISTPGDGVEILAYPNLKTRPEFARLINQNQNITLNDMIALDIEEERKNVPNPDDASKISIVDQTETTVNIVDSTTNQTVQTLPAREVVYGLPAAFGDAIYVKYALIVLADDGNTGYALHSITRENIELDEGMPTYVRQAFDSFELLTTTPSASTNTIAATAAPSPAQEKPQQEQQPSPPSQQLQSPQQPEVEPQENQDGGTSVSIVSGSSSLTTDAYSPNPIQVNVGDTVAWTNDDIQPHTVSSGENVTPSGLFESGIMAPDATFEHTFTEAGEYPYFCLLHPNMVGTVSVN